MSDQMQSCGGLRHFSRFGPRPVWDGPASARGSSTRGREPAAGPGSCTLAPGEFLVRPQKSCLKAFGTQCPQSRGRQRESQCPAWLPPSLVPQLAGRARLPPVLTPGTQAKAVAGLTAAPPRSVLGVVQAWVEELLRAPCFSSHTPSAAGQRPRSAAASAPSPFGRLRPRCTHQGALFSWGLWLPSLPEQLRKELQKADRKASSF